MKKTLSFKMIFLTLLTSVSLLSSSISSSGQANFQIDRSIDIGEGEAEIHHTRIPFVPIAATIDIHPDTLSLRSSGEWTTAYIELLECFDVTDINVSSVLLNDTIPVDPSAPTEIGDYDNDSVSDLMVKFNRTEVEQHILGSVTTAERYMDVALTVTGKLYDGTPFEGADTIKLVRSIDRSIEEDSPSSTRYDWPMVCHNLGHTSYTESPAPNTNQTLWKFTTGNYVVSSPAIVNGKVYVGSWDGKVYCLDALAGSCMWNYTTGNMVGSSPAVVNERLYIGSYDFRVYCLDALAGTQIWNYTTSDSRISSPAVVNGMVYVGSGNIVYALNASTGAHMWDYATSAIVRSSPAVVDGRLFVGSLDNKTYSLNASTGAHIWNYTTGSGVSSSPSVVDGKVYVGSDDRNVYCLDAATGERIWNYTTGSSVYGSPAVAYGRVYVGSNDHRVYALDALTGTHIWNYTTEDEMYGTVATPAVADDKIYIGSGDGSVYALNASNGAKIWKLHTGAQPVGSSPAIADGVVYLGTTYDHNVWAIGNVIKSEDYGTIQEAIDAASPEATIWIAPGAYSESLTINKTLTIIGKPGSSPVFDGGGSGVFATLLKGASGTIIAGITMTSWNQGVLIADASNCKIYHNTMSQIQENGVELEGASAANNVIYANTFKLTSVAVNVTGSSSGNTVSKNIISYSATGLVLESDGNTVYANIIANNSEAGISILSSSQANVIHHNNFINNTVNAETSGSANTWDDGYPSGGNHWSTHTDPDAFRGPGQNIPGSDGIVDTNYTLATGNVDRYPLAKPYSPHDIGLISLTASKKAVGQGEVFVISMKIINHGVYTECFTVVAYANTTAKTVVRMTLVGRDVATVTYSWVTSSLAMGNYSIRVCVGPVTDETDMGDNVLVDGWVFVSIVGDVNGDRKVDLKDVYAVAKAYGSFGPDYQYPGSPPHPNWKTECDINGDNKVDLKDYYATCKNYGKQW